MAYLLNRTDIYCDEDNQLECPNCYGNSLSMYSVEVDLNKKNKEEIKDVLICFKCVDCKEEIKKLKLINNKKETNVSINWLLNECEYAHQVYKLFKQQH